MKSDTSHVPSHLRTKAVASVTQGVAKAQVCSNDFLSLMVFIVPLLQNTTRICLCRALTYPIERICVDICWHLVSCSRHDWNFCDFLPPRCWWKRWAVPMGGPCRAFSTAWSSHGISWLAPFVPCVPCAPCGPCRAVLARRTFNTKGCKENIQGDSKISDISRNLKNI